ncbi:LamG-like jellyroll fold domain-containing protein [Streptomyces sp. KL110A]|uniref:LamG-like jellyroll fold domain-containing protein n=1 Tax=Streptomyces sp. KL110A TaxID=3384221 RepID=UPI0038C3DAAE
MNVRTGRGRRALGRGRALALSTVVALLAGVAPAVSAGPAAADEAPAVVLPESEQALKQAAESGDRVEVVGERTEWETVFANPDGGTFTLEKSIVPVRVKEGTGWVRPDATLERREDGSIGPKAAVVDVSFSSGGPGTDLVSIGKDGQSVSMGWPGRLPEPRLEGERAVYENVLPDVNLILTATVEGFRQVLEVETPAAAALPELQAIDYSLEADGLRLREGVVGSVEALDGNGQVVFRSPTARMWNSAGDDTAPDGSGVSTQSAGARAMPGAAGEADTAVQDVPELVAPPQEGDPLSGPRAGDEAAVMEMELGQDSLTIVPDAALIAATEAEDFPLYIDPPVELGQTQRTVLSSDGDVFYNFTNGENGMSVGKCGSAVINGQSYYCGSGYVNRMYFEFSPSNLRGKYVLDATFRVTETWSFSCDARWVDLDRTNPISTASKYPGPDKRDHVGDRNVSAGRGTLCSPSQPRAVIEFNDNPAEPDENLTANVRDFADGTLKNLTLRLKAKDETDTISWKRFNNDATISVVYMSKPAMPGEYGFPSGSTQICSTSASAPTTISDPTPRLAATPRAMPGSESGAILRAYFDVDGRNADGTWFDAPQPTTSSVEPTTSHASYSVKAKDFSNQVKEWNVALKEGVLYRYQASTHSFADTTYTTVRSGPGTSWCYFKVDSTAPKPPVVKFNTVYTECVSGGACEPGGAPNKTGSFTFTFNPSDSITTNTHYQYNLSGGGWSSGWSSWKAASVGSYTTNLTPPISGSFILQVRSKDVLNRPGESAVKFLVKEGAGPIGRWDFSEESGVALDTSTTNDALRNNLTLTAAGATRSEHGRRGQLEEADGTKPQDKALSLTPAAQGSATSSQQVVETLSSYTLTAWARLDQAGTANATVLAQDGARHSPFYLSYCADVETWCVRLPDKDADGASFSSQRVDALNKPQVGAWTHLGVVVDIEAEKLSLYVNGALQKSDVLTASPFASAGALKVGRAKYASAYTDFFPGEVDEVAVWQSALGPVQMAEEAGLRQGASSPNPNWAFVELVAQYNPLGATGMSLPDSSGYGNTLTMASGASLNGETIALDGVDDSATTARPLVDDTGSFSVTTSVMVDQQKFEALPNNTRLQVLGQRTAAGASWGIWFEKTGTIPVESDEEPTDPNAPPVFENVAVGRWHFGRVDASGTDPDGSVLSVQSEKTYVPSGEVEVTGVFDATSRTVRLFIGGTANADPLVYESRVGTGFTVGKAWTGSTWSSFFPGTIRDIRLWAGAFTNDEQVQAVVGS